MAIEEYTIKTFDEFNIRIESLIQKGFTFFRGDKFSERSKDNLLLTSFDKKKNGSFLYPENVGDSMINDFMSIALSRLDYKPQLYFEKMLTAQHYGIPTRLQDWSESPLVSLFFSTNSSKDLDDNDSCIIWCLNPIKLNSFTKRIVSEVTGEPYIPNISLDPEKEDSSLGYILDHYGPKESPYSNLYPIAISTYKINPRIEAQKGVFLIYPRQRKSLIEYDHVQDFLIKLTIPRSTALHLEDILLTYKINNFQMFPEISSIAKDVTNHYMN